MEWFNNLLMKIGLKIMEWSFQTFDNDDDEITIIDQLRWVFEDIGSQIYLYGYENSEQEIEDALSGEIPFEHLTDNQIYIYLHQKGEK